MAFEGELAPSFTLHCLEPGRTPPDGWGLGYYPGGEPSAAILKEPAPPQASIRSQLALAWEKAASSRLCLPPPPPRRGAPAGPNPQACPRAGGPRRRADPPRRQPRAKARRDPRPVRAG